MTVEAEEITFASLRENVERTFHHLAESKSLAFHVDIDAGSCRARFTTDPKRLQQILKNLLSNAFKFTSQGRVAMTVRHVTEGWSPEHPVLRFSPSAVAFAVSDTGIGIAPEKQKLIFEAFQQADAGTSRKYGGTGLGLAISRELASLLGGEIRLVSIAGTGQHLHALSAARLPRAGARRHATTATECARRNRPHVTTPSLPVLAVKSDETIVDDRHDIVPGDRVMLIVDDDPHYARVLLGLAREKGFKGVVALRGQTALALARELAPTAITLDVFLPDMLGWTVLNNLKLDPATRHIPVQMLSVEAERQHGLSHGAFSYLVKPATTEELEEAFDRIRVYVSPHTKRLLVVEDNDIERDSIVELLDHDDIEITAVGTGAEALAALTPAPIDCCVVDLRLPDMSGFELLDKLQDLPGVRDVPVVVFTGKELTEDDELRLRTVAKSVVLKDVQSPERLLRRDGALPPPRRRRSARGATRDAGPAARLERRPAQPQGAGGRRRCAQHLCVDDRAREPRHAGAERDQRPPGDRRDSSHAGSERGADGHHDARHGRLRDDA